MLRHISTLLFALSLSSLALATSGHNALGHHQRRLDVTPNQTQLEKRFDNTRFTYFYVGTNACGGFDHDNDYVIALNTHQWDNRAHCGNEVTIHFEGKSATARVTDLCMECPWGAIDLSPGLFSYLAGGLGRGTVYGSWTFGGAPPPPPPPPPPKKTTTTTSTTQSRTSSSTSKSSTSTTNTSTTTSTSTSTTQAPSPSATPSVIGELGAAMVQLGGLVGVALAG